MKKIGITEFRQNMKKTIDSLNTGERMEVLQNNRVIFVVTKKGE